MNGLYHIFQEFLSNLDRPLNVPDDKITRWHPKFRLDEVPDIEPAEVPKSPNVQVYQTAKDVLENARGKVLPNVSMLTNIVKKFTIKHEKNRNRKFTHPFYRVLSKDHDKEIKIDNLALMCTKMYNLHIDITIRNQTSLDHYKAIILEMFLKLFTRFKIRKTCGSFSEIVHSIIEIYILCKIYMYFCL